MLKSQRPIKNDQQGELPSHLLSKDKKTNEIVEKHFIKNKIRKQRNKLSELLHNFKPGYLEPEFQGDQTLKVSQEQIFSAVNIQTASNIFDLKLNMGGYRSHYSYNGSTLLLTSSEGHVSLMNWREKQLLLEINLRQQIIDSCFLHNDEMFALSQPSHTYIYDNRGIQLHKLHASLGLQYLPYHFLLASYDQRKLKYYDVTTGHIIADHVAKNPYTIMRQNKSNAIVALGSAKGVVEWWTPGIGTPAVKIFAGSKVDDIGFYKGYMFTASENLKVWDTRMLKVLHQAPLHRRINSLELSQSGIIAINYGFKLEFYKDLHTQKQNLPYLKYQPKNNQINNINFIPFQDLLGIGLNSGFSCIAVPGSGVPFYDTFQNNPFESKKQKRQALVHKLLEKLAPETITVDPNILGNINKVSREVLEEEDKEEKLKNDKQRIEKLMLKKKMKGKNKTTARINRKNIELDKIRRAELTKTINTKLWARWAEKKKKDSELSLINQMESEGLGLADLIVKNAKTKQIRKQ